MECRLTGFVELGIKMLEGQISGTMRMGLLCRPLETPRLCPMRQLRRNNMHLNMQKSSLSVLEEILCEVLSLIWLIRSQV